MRLFLRFFIYCILFYCLFSCSISSNGTGLKSELNNTEQTMQFFGNQLNRSNSIPGLVAEWLFSGNPLDEYALDTSGNGNDAEIRGATLIEDRFGTPNSAYYFDGVDDWLEVPDASELDLMNSFTISLYVKPDIDNGYYTGGFYDNPNAASTVISKDGLGPNDSRRDPYGAYNLYIRRISHDDPNTLTQTILYEIYNNRSNNFTGPYVRPEFEMNSKYHHIVWWHHGDTWKVWLDGVMVSNMTSTREPSNLTTQLLIGRRGWDNGFFKGCIDDISIYNRGLSDSEIAELSFKTNHKYELITSFKNWHAAKLNCETRGGHLVTITSAEEQSHITKYFNLNDHPWIGATDELVEGSWQWVTGEPWSYTAWYLNRPVIDYDANYARFWKQGKWLDTKNANRRYICEWNQ